MLTIVADENIPLLDPFFAQLGRIVRLPGRAIRAEDVRDADILLVRSVTSVDRALLAGSRVRFVGTCTIGTDHVDQAWLSEQGIAFASAPGCNAWGVVNYVLSALTVLAEEQGFAWGERCVGIIGCGNVGGRLQQTLERLGVRTLVCDPFKEPAEGVTFCTLDELIDQADIISCHTPLTRDGEHPTWHLLDAARLQRLKPGACLINSSRGAVVDNAALKALLKVRPDLQVVLDVWESEPEPDPELMAQVALATPHIAGYSQEGKWNGTAMIYQAVCHQFGLPARVQLAGITPMPPLKSLSLNASAEPWDTLFRAIRLVYDLRSDDHRMRRALAASACPGETFDQLRKGYPVRREFSSLRIKTKKCPLELQQLFRGAGFRLLQD